MLTALPRSRTAMPVFISRPAPRQTPSAEPRPRSATSSRATQTMECGSTAPEQIVTISMEITSAWIKTGLRRCPTAAACSSRSMPRATPLAGPLLARGTSYPGTLITASSSAMATTSTSTETRSEPARRGRKPPLATALPASSSPAPPRPRILPSVAPTVVKPISLHIKPGLVSISPARAVTW